MQYNRPVAKILSMGDQGDNDYSHLSPGQLRSDYKQKTLANPCRQDDNRFRAAACNHQEAITLIEVSRSCMQAKQSLYALLNKRPLPDPTADS